MPSHLVKPSPINMRRLPQRGGRPMPRAAVQSIQQRLGDYRNTEYNNGDEYNNEWNDRRGWNDNNTGGPGPGTELLSDPYPAVLPPPPPENLNWNEPYPGNRSEIVGVRRRDMSANMGDFMDFDDQPRGPKPALLNDVYGEVDHSALNDFQRGMEQLANMRNFRDSNMQFRNLDMENPMVQKSFSSSGYQSFDDRRGDPNIMESLNNRRHYPEQGNQGNDQWRPFDDGTEGARKRRRESPSPLGPVHNRAAPQPGPRNPVRPHGAPEISDKTFNIGGFKLPYIRTGWQELPQPESKSYTIRFFKRPPAYRIYVKKVKSPSGVEHVYTESQDFAEQKEGVGRISLFRLRDDFGKEWTKIYRARSYGSWNGWWTDFHSINLDIDEQLNKFEAFNVKYNFMPPVNTFDFVDQIKRAQVALVKNRNNYLGNMRVIYGLMNPYILGNMPVEAVAQLQDIIRSVPNHLWIYKLRCMVYLWYSYSQVMKGTDTNDKKYQFVLKEWNSPVIHWVAKQALIELRSISQSEFPEFNKLFRTPKAAKD